jgi:hypothetical protein
MPADDTMTPRDEVHRAMWQAWSAADDACRDAGALVDAEQFDDATYLMLVEARDQIKQAMRREGFQEPADVQAAREAGAR